jgi:hypothetical protein
MSISYTTVEDLLGQKLDKMFGVKYSFLRVKPGNCLLPPQYVFIGQKIRDLEVRDSDVWLVSYPRTGKDIYCVKMFIFFIFKTFV